MRFAIQDCTSETLWEILYD